MNTLRLRSAAGVFLGFTLAARAAVFTVINTDDSGPGSFRQAILGANATTEYGYIHFNIPGAGPHTISPATGLPPITNSVVIDGYTQPAARENTSPSAFNGVLKIEINGAGAGAGVSGLVVQSPSTSAQITIRGLVVNRFSDAGVFVSQYGKFLAEGNLIGTDPTGLIARPNGRGCFLWGSEFGTFVTMGGLKPGARNVISGNASHGIDTLGESTIRGANATVRSNFIGVDATGVHALPNGGSGVNLPANAGATTLIGNVISGNGGHGVATTHRTAARPTILGNAIGTDASGTVAIGNAGNGLFFEGSGAIALGGFALGEANIISANGGSGIVARSVGVFIPTVPWIANAVFGNGSLELNLSGNDLASGVTTNDVGDFDAGPNDLQNFPVLTSVLATNGGFVVSGTLDSRTNRSYLIDFYRSPVQDGSGYGGGMNYFGTTNVTTSPVGSAAFEFPTTAPLQGQWITAIARDPNAGNGASEFSQAVLTPGVFGGNVQLNSVGTVVNESDGVASLQLVRTDGTNGTVTVNYSTTDGTALAGSDYTAVSSSVTFAAGETNKIITVPIIKDMSGETLESFFVVLTGANGDGALGLITNATVNIDDDDPLPQLSINDVSLAEGNSSVSFMIFTVSLSAPSAETVSVAYATTDGTATVSGNDYVADANLVVFAPGETAKPVTLSIKGDTLPEGDESFYVTLSSATNAAIAKFLGVGTILNDDPPPAISINDISATEGNSGNKGFTFTLTLSGPSALTVQVDYGTAPGTAMAETDFVPANGTVQFAAGTTSAVVSVSVIGDLVLELGEAFFLNLSNAVNATIADAQGQATILNDDAPPSSLSINDISVSEGNSGSTFAAFTVTLTPISSVPVSVAFVSSNGTAIAPADYAAGSGTLLFNPGETVKPVTVTIKGDPNPELNETFFVNLGSPSNATLAKAEGICTILNDDEPTLGVQMLSGEAMLFWPATYEGFQLCWATNLDSSNHWMPVLDPITTTNGTNYVMQVLLEPAKFYRLQAP